MTASAHANTVAFAVEVLPNRGVGSQVLRESGIVRTKGFLYSAKPIALEVIVRPFPEIGERRDEAKTRRNERSEFNFPSSSFRLFRTYANVKFEASRILVANRLWRNSSKQCPPQIRIDRGARGAGKNEQVRTKDSI